MVTFVRRRRGDGAGDVKPRHQPIDCKPTDICSVLELHTPQPQLPSVSRGTPLPWAIRYVLLPCHRLSSVVISFMPRLLTYPSVVLTPLSQRICEVIFPKTEGLPFQTGGFAMKLILCTGNTERQHTTNERASTYSRTPNVVQRGNLPISITNQERQLNDHYEPTPIFSMPSKALGNSAKRSRPPLTTSSSVPPRVMRCLSNTLVSNLYVRTKRCASRLSVKKQRRKELRSF